MFKSFGQVWYRHWGNES